MRHIDWTYRGDAYPMAFTADALFRIYDRCGEGNLVEIAHLADNTEEGFHNLCWIAAMLIMEAELQRRYMGEDPHPMLSAEELQLSLTPAEIPPLREAILAAVRQGFETAATPEEEEINLVLQERAQAKKAKTPASPVSDFFRRLFTLSD